MHTPSCARKMSKPKKKKKQVAAPVPRKRPMAGRKSGPAKGKKYVKITASGKKVSYGAKGYSIAPGTKKGDSYCSRSAGQ